MPEEARREVDGGRVDGRQRVVDEVDVLPPGGDARLDIALGRELQMLALPPRYRIGVISAQRLVVTRQPDSLLAGTLAALADTLPSVAEEGPPPLGPLPLRSSLVSFEHPRRLQRGVFGRVDADDATDHFLGVLTQERPGPIRSL